MNETKENDEYVITSAKDDMLLRLSVCSVNRVTYKMSMILLNFWALWMCD